jgi:hypothetical protein
MADSEGVGALVGALFWMVLVVAAVITAVMALMSVGSLFGAGTALRNYGLAFANNVRPQRVTK